jgi:hypothetical protein
MSSRAAAGASRRGLGANTKPSAQAPSRAASSTSASRVRPQIFTTGPDGNTDVAPVVSMTGSSSARLEGE